MTFRTKLLFWLLFSIPGILLMASFLRGTMAPGEMVHPSGEMAVRLMVGAMLAGPLADYFGLNRFFRGWIALRRSLGVIAFTYALLHLLFYIANMETLPAVLGDLEQPAIWTGWIALALMLIPAAISFDTAMRALGRRWKRLQQLAYAALFLSLIHWVLLDWQWGPALIHLSPLAVAWALRVMARKGQRPKAGYASSQ